VNDVDFAELCRFSSDALLLLSGDGRILASNPLAREKLGLENDEAASGACRLHQAVTGDPGEVDRFLKQCRRSSDDVLGVISHREGTRRLRTYGRLIFAGDAPEQSRVLMRFAKDEDPIHRFAILNAKIDELNREVARRRILEEELREQHDLAAFGRDVGLALASDNGLSSTLQHCSELLVTFFDALFARIWVVSDDGKELLLMASAGRYTHLDGPHSRIPVGQFKIGLIAEEGQPHLTNSVIGDERVHDQEWAIREKLVAFAGYPLKIDQRTMGVMAIFARHELSDASLAAMKSVANSVAIGIDRKHSEETLKQQSRALRLAARRKDEFLAMLAHELRNPLAPILSGLEVLRLQAGETEMIDVMCEQLHHLTCLVDDLLDTSRIMRGRIELRSEPVLLDEVIDHAVATVTLAFKSHQHQLTVHGCGSPVWVNGDKVRLGQIITNLLMNAAKYTPDGGQISLETAMDSAQVTLAVRDNGIGIETELQTDIFELFTQAERGLARSEGGLGIGLTLVSRLVELHGGEIEVHSDGAGTGSEFIVHLPTTSAPEQPEDLPDPAEFSMPRNCRILVVDDSVGSAKILRRLLTAIGGECIEMAHSGPAAVAAAKSFRPDVVFLDIGLPGLTGFQVAEQLRADERFHSTLLIALTGYGTAEDRQKSRDAGFDGHLVKPVSVDQLKQAIASPGRPSGLT